MPGSYVQVVCPLTVRLLRAYSLSTIFPVLHRETAKGAEQGPASCGRLPQRSISLTSACGGAGASGQGAFTSAFCTISSLFVATQSSVASVCPARSRPTPVETYVEI